MKKWYLITSLLIVMVLAPSCVFISQAPAQPGKLMIISQNLTEGGAGKAIVQVKVKNVGPSTIELAKVTVYFYDAKGNLINIVDDAVMNLKPGQTWDFEIACSGAGCDQVKKYEIEAMAATSSGVLPK